MTPKERLQRWLAAARRYGEAVELTARGLLSAPPLKDGEQSAEDALGRDLVEVFATWKGAADSPEGAWERQRDALRGVDKIIPRIDTLEAHYQSLVADPQSWKQRPRERQVAQAVLPLVIKFKEATDEARSAKLFAVELPRPKRRTSKGSANTEPPPPADPAKVLRLPSGLRLRDRRSEDLVEHAPREGPVKGVVIYITGSKDLESALAPVPRTKSRRHYHYVIEPDGLVHHLASEDQALPSKGTTLPQLDGAVSDGTVAVALINQGHAREGVRAGPDWIRAHGGFWEPFQGAQLGAAVEIVAQIEERAGLQEHPALWPASALGTAWRDNPGRLFPAPVFIERLVGRLGHRPPAVHAGPQPPAPSRSGTGWGIPLLAAMVVGLGAWMRLRPGMGQDSP